MKILSVVPQKQRKQFRTISVEGGGSFKLHEEIVGKYGLSENMELTESQIEEIRFFGEKKEAMEYAFLLLNYKDRSSKEISDRLKRKGFSGRTIESAIKNLQKLKLVNDGALALGLAESKLKNKLLGKTRIHQDLMRRGIEKSVAENAVKDLETSRAEEFPNEEERAYQLIEKRIKQIHAADSHALYRRLFDYLSRRGFPYDTVERALSRFRKEQRQSESE